jgi:hypothetical protein
MLFRVVEFPQPDGASYKWGGVQNNTTLSGRFDETDPSS